MDYNITRSTFEDLIVWKKARELRMDLSRILKTFPHDEKYKLTNQL